MRDCAFGGFPFTYLVGFKSTYVCRNIPSSLLLLSRAFKMTTLAKRSAAPSAQAKDAAEETVEGLRDTFNLLPEEAIEGVEMERFKSSAGLQKRLEYLQREEEEIKEENAEANSVELSDARAALEVRRRCPCADRLLPNSNRLLPNSQAYFLGLARRQFGDGKHCHKQTKKRNIKASTARGRACAVLYCSIDSWGSLECRETLACKLVPISQHCAHTAATHHLASELFYLFSRHLPR